jgi:hypothetical protein
MIEKKNGLFQQETSPEKNPEKYARTNIPLESPSQVESEFRILKLRNVTEWIIFYYANIS